MDNSKACGLRMAVLRPSLMAAVSLKLDKACSAPQVWDNPRPLVSLELCFSQITWGGTAECFPMWWGRTTPRGLCKPTPQGAGVKGYHTVSGGALTLG